MITCMGTLLIATLATVLALVMRKFLNKLHSAEQTQQERVQDGMYEMVDSRVVNQQRQSMKVVDHEPEEVNTSQNLYLLLILHTYH